MKTTAATKHVDIGRLALRVEGEFWNAYWAPTGSMERAILLGSLRLSIAAIPKRKQAFMDPMRDALGDIIAEKAGTRPSWDAPTSAPEHERAGSS